MKKKGKGGLDPLDRLCWRKGKKWKKMHWELRLKLMLREEKMYAERVRD